MYRHRNVDSVLGGPAQKRNKNGREVALEGDITMPRASSDLPPWLWRTLVCVVGVGGKNQLKKGVTDRRWLAMFMQSLTYFLAIVFLITYTWTVMSGILYYGHSSIQGSASIIMAVCWCCVGIYSRNVAHRMLDHPNVGTRVQLVFQSLFRINVTLLVVIFSLILLTVNNYDIRIRLDNQQRENGSSYGIEFVREIMFATRILFSGFAWLWNILVVFILMSTCRSYTLGIRRFIRDLESDASAYDKYCHKMFIGAASQHAEYNIFSEYIWLDEDNSETTFASQLPSNSGGQEKEKQGQYYKEKDRRLSLTTISELTESPVTDAELSCSDLIIQHHNDTFYSPATNLGKTTFVSDCIARKAHSPHTCSSSVSGSERGSFDAETSGSLDQLQLLTLDQILHRHWKISCRLRLLSCALQRWMVCFFSLCLGWTIAYLTYWLNHTPSLIDVVQFIIPLVLIPLIGSAYAEVNYEGKRMLKFVCPLEERFFMIDYLNSNPLQMVVYDFQVTYSAIVTAILGLLLALSSGIILQEMTEN